jgi:hypothetical protein
MKLQKSKDKKEFKAHRERSRMRQINASLVFLRIVLHNCIAEGYQSYDFEHLPKIEIIKLAINYIALLQAQLSGEQFSDEDYLLKLSVNLKKSTIKMLRKVLK